MNPLAQAPDTPGILPTEWAGLPAWRLVHASGDSATVTAHGAQLVSWVSAGRERLYFSPQSQVEARTAMRGGVPICFPQFNQRGPLPKHGIARLLDWQWQAAGADTLALALQDSPATRSDWDQAFALRYEVRLCPGQVQMTLHVHNTDARPLAFTGALHTYFAVQDATRAQLTGLAGQPEWDSVADRHAPAAQTLCFGTEFDRVYHAAPGPLVLHDGAQRLTIEQSPSWAHTVVWNPGPERCATIPDLPATGWTHMLCVEAAQVFEPCVLAPSQHWQGWQRLTLAQP